MVSVKEFGDQAVMITPSFDQPAGAQTWLTLVEFTAPISAGGVSTAPGGAATLLDRLAEILTPLAIPQVRLQRIQTAVEGAILHTAARVEAGSPQKSSRVVLRINVSRGSTSEEEGQPRSMRETVPIWTGGRYGWGFFLVEQGVRENAGYEDHWFQLYLYPEGGD